MGGSSALDVLQVIYTQAISNANRCAEIIG